MPNGFKNIKEADIANKTVLLRADLDVSLAKGEILDDFRLITSLETINYLLKHTKTIFIIGHLGRPEKEDKSLSLKVVAMWYADKFQGNLKDVKVKGFSGWEIIPGLILLENLRFYEEEEKNDLEFSQKLASLAEAYVNDAFASSHRNHASIVGVTEYLPSFAGFRLQKEVNELTKVLDNPNRPLTIIIGGAKIETKLPLVEKMHHFADYVLVGGELSEKDNVLIRVMHEKADKVKSMLFVADLTESKKEITEYSTENFIQVINKSATIVWNGPMGQVEKIEYSKETKKLGEAIVKSQAYSIVGGGDTVAFLQKEGLADKFSFVSTGGGAMLEFLSGEKLPGLEALNK